jgi:hypothetical protein
VAEQRTTDGTVISAAKPNAIAPARSRLSTLGLSMAVVVMAGISVSGKIRFRRVDQNPPCGVGTDALGIVDRRVLIYKRIPRPRHSASVSWSPHHLQLGRRSST